jgi:hypothetical protein
MNLKPLALVMVLSGFAPWAAAGELPPDVSAKLIKIIVTSSGGKVGCRDATIKSALEAAGVPIDGSAKAAWSTNPAEIRMLKSQGKLVITNRTEHLAAGASIALTEEGGRPKIFLHPGNLAASGITLSDAVLKMGEKI